MIQEIKKVILQPLKAVWSIFDNDAHKIISKRGIEVLGEQKTKNNIIHDVSKSFYCKDQAIYSFDKCKKVCEYCERFEN